MIDKNKAAREKGKSYCGKKLTNGNWKYSMIFLEKGKQLNQDVNVTIKTIRKLNVLSCQRMKEKLCIWEDELV